MLPVVVNNMLPPPRQRQVLARFSALALVASLPLLYVSLLRPPPAALAGDTAFWFLMSNCVIGALFFGSPSKADGGPSSGCHDDDGLEYSYSYVSGGGGGQPAAAVAFEEASNSIGALPFSVHASVLQQRGEEHEVAPVQPSTDKSNDAVLKGQGEDEEDIARPSRASGDDDEAVAGAVADDFDTIKAANDRALPVGPEPGLVEEEEDLPEAWAIAQHSRTPDLLQHVKRSGEGKKLRRSSTEGSKPAEAEGREYWDELTDEELNMRVEEFIARFRREMIEQEAGVVVV